MEVLMGKSIINGGFHGKIICNWAILTMAMLNNQRVSKNEHLTWLVGGWAYPSEKYDFVSWDDEIPNIWKKKNTNHMS